MYKLSNWTLKEGPQFKQSEDPWKQIRGNIDSEDIPAAAAKLRRTSEEYFSNVCESLQVETKHKENSGYDLGELLPPAISKYNELLIKAKKAAQSWGRKEEVKKLSRIHNESKEIIKESEVEKWTINANVHYNSWADFTPNEFRPVVDTFERLFKIFKCPECGNLLHLSMIWAVYSLAGERSAYPPNWEGWFQRKRLLNTLKSVRKQGWFISLVETR